MDLEKGDLSGEHDLEPTVHRFAHSRAGPVGDRSFTGSERSINIKRQHSDHETDPVQ